MTNVPITYGSGQASIAGDTVASTTYQQIKVVDGTIGSNTALIVNSDGTLNARISGSVATAGGTFTGSVSGTVGASIIGTVPVTQTTSPWIITGSVQGTPVANQSVSGTVGASIIGQLPAGTAVLGSVAVLQGTSPWNISGSVAAIQTGTRTTSIVGGASVFQTGTWSVSVAGTVNVSGSVVAFQGTNPFIITGSVQGTSAANQSVSGTVQTDVRGSVATVIIGGSIAASFTPPANQSVSGTVQTDVRGSVAVAIISGSITASFTPPANQSVSGTVNIGTGGPVSVLGTMSVLGTVPVTQSTTPWVITGSVQGSFSPAANQSVSGTVQVDVRGSIAAVIIGGSIATATTNSSVMLLNGANTIGSVTALQGTNPWIVTSSVAGGIFPISGSVAATITNTNLNVGGSVVAFQGTSPFVVNFQNSSIIAIQAGSVISINIGSTIAVLQSPSIVGTYAEDSVSNTGDKGLFVLAVRNDTLTSVTSNDGDYGTFAIGPSGEHIVVNAPYTKWVQGTADFRQGNTGASIVLISTGGTSVFSYITGVQVANMGSASVLVTLASSGSILGYTIAPAGGGSNIYYQNALKTPSNGNFAASISGVASVLVSAQGFLSKS